ncbi:MAG: 6-bladed beta-propeller [Melioribacteraceae bacterium]|nr:6-bladed beta-propeller [Melioribacteraceae bacterium]
MDRIILYIVLLTNLLFVTLPAQNNEGSQFSIEWTKNFTSENEIKTEEGVFSKLINLVAGATEEKLIKPFNLISLGIDTYFILDQGRFTPILVSNDGFEIIQNEEYKTFPSLVGVCKFKEGSLLFTDSKLSKIFIYNFIEEDLKVFSTSQKLENTTGIFYDAINRLIYVTETANHRILVFNEDGEFQRSIGKRGHRDGEFNFPTFLTVDKKGTLFVVDGLNFRVQVFDKDGSFIKSFGEAGDASGYFNRPKGITVDSYGHLFIVDALFHTVQVFNSDGNFLYNFGGMGQLNSRFWMPIGITIDEDNNIFIADSYNSRIQIFRLIDDK